jgi:hypothetical protein
MLNIDIWSTSSWKLIGQGRRLCKTLTFDLPQSGNLKLIGQGRRLCKTLTEVYLIQHYVIKFVSDLWWGVLDTTLCDKVCQWLVVRCTLYNVVIGTDYIDSCKSNYHTITATTAPFFFLMTFIYQVILLSENYFSKLANKPTMKK